MKDKTTLAIVCQLSLASLLTAGLTAQHENPAKKKMPTVGKFRVVTVDITGMT